MLTQRPKKTELQMGENLLRGDAPVIEFRSRRDELKRAARQALTFDQFSGLCRARRA